MKTDDSWIEIVERYSSWKEYQQRHPFRAKEISSLGVNLEKKSDSDASEWIYSIESLAHDSNCKISELKRKYYELFESRNVLDSEWISLIPFYADQSKKEAEKGNVKIGNTIYDVMLSFLFDKIKEIEFKYADSPILTKADPLTLQMRFLLESNDDVLLLQKLHIYIRKYPMDEENKKYRDNWHLNMMEIIENRISKFENIKNNPKVYNLAVSTEIYKFVHDEVIKEYSQKLVSEFNAHLLSFYEEMEIISQKASEKFMLRI